MLEGITAAVIFLLLMTRGRKLKDGYRARMFLILYSSAQIILEALRRDNFLRWLFVRVSQVASAAVLLGLLNEQFGPGVTLSGQEDGLVVLVGARGGDYERWATASRVATSNGHSALIVPSVTNSDVGVDFVVTVPAGSDVAAVKALVRRYVFAGVGFRVQEASN